MLVHISSNRLTPTFCYWNVCLYITCPTRETCKRLLQKIKRHRLPFALEGFQKWCMHALKVNVTKFHFSPQIIFSSKLSAEEKRTVAIWYLCNVEKRYPENKSVLKSRNFEN